MIFTINSSTVVWLFMHAFYERKEADVEKNHIGWGLFLFFL